MTRRMMTRRTCYMMYDVFDILQNVLINVTLSINFYRLKCYKR